MTNKEKADSMLKFFHGNRTLEKVIEEYFKGWTDDYDNGGAACHYQYVQVQDCKAIAKHFFELGLKAQKVE